MTDADRPSDEALKESEAFRGAILEAAVDAIITIDEGGTIVSVNRACERLFGYASSELLGENVSKLMPSSDGEQHDRYLERYVQTGERRIIGIGREVEARRKNGIFIPVELSVSEVELPRKRYFTGILRDISARKRAEEALRESEERFREIAEKAPGLFWVVQATDDRVLYVSPRYGEIWDRDPQRLVSDSRDWLEAIHPDDRNRVEVAYSYSLSDSRSFEEIYRVVRSDGSHRWIHDRGTVVADESERTVRMIRVAEDITERELLRQRIVEQESLARLGELAAVVAHEVKNPIAGIGGALRIIADRMPAESEDRTVLHDSISRLEDLGKLVDDILSFARPQSPKPSPVPVLLLLDDVVSLFRQDPRFVDVDVRVRGLDLSANCEMEMIRPVILNVLVNAGEAMSGTGSVRVEVAEDGPFCKVEVVDTGPGIPESAAGRVFEPFFSTKHRGTGLGLAIARRVVELHGGDIAMDPAPEGGARVLLRLPLARRSRT